MTGSLEPLKDCHFGMRYSQVERVIGVGNFLPG